VTEQYIQRRRREILDAAWQCFARDGFHATTMDDVIAAAGVSPSVVYRWFRGKDELVAAAADEVLHGVVDVLDDALRLDPPPPLADAVQQILTATLARTSHNGPDLAALAVQTWAESLRNPEIHTLVANLYNRVRNQFAELIRHHQSAGTLPADIDPDAAARPLFSLIPGFVLQQLLLGHEDPESYAAAARMLLRA
jgi:AcrR family transcriptional regulator